MQALIANGNQSQEEDMDAEGAQNGQPNYRPEKPKDQIYSLEPSLLESIRRYEGLLASCTEELEKKIIIGTLDSLKGQLAILSQSKQQNRGSSYQDLQPLQGSLDLNSGKKQMMEERRELILKEIYDFYCRQTYVEGINSTFDRIKHESNTLSLGKLCLICKDLGLLKGEDRLSRDKILEIFKKNATYSKEATFEQFLSIMKRFAEELFPDDSAKDDKFYHRLFLEDGKWKNKLRLLNMPFHMKDKKPDQRNHNYKFQVFPQTGKTQQEVIEEITRRKEQRLNERKERSMTTQNVVKIKQPLPPSKQLEKPDNFSGQQILKRNKESTNKNKITWEKLENITFKDLSMLVGEKTDESFNPKHLFDGQDTEEDNYYLAEFNLESDKRADLHKNAASNLPSAEQDKKPRKVKGPSPNHGQPAQPA